MKMTKPTMTVHIQNLEKLGLTFKEKAEDDKRKSYIRISELGRKIEKGENNAFRRLEDLVKEKLSEDEVKEFKRILEKLNVE